MLTSKAALEIVLRARDEASRHIGQVGDSLDEMGEEMKGVDKAARKLQRAMMNFDTSAKTVWDTLLRTDRAAEMTGQEMGTLATRLGVASSAEVEAKLKMEQLITAWNKGEISSEQLTDGLDKLDKGLDDVGEEMKGASGAADMLKTAITAAGIIAAGKAAYELAHLGAQSQRARRRFGELSGGMEEATRNLEAMKEATRGAVSEQALMEQGGKLLMTGLAQNSEELAKVTELAVLLGDANQSASERIENFSLMLLNTSIPRLDSYGMSGSQTRARILELQAATEGLSREEAFKIAVFEQGEAAMLRLGDAAVDDLIAFERLEAQTADLRAEMGERLAPAMADILETGLRLLTWTEDTVAVLNEHEAAVRMAASGYDEYKTEMVRAAVEQGYMVDQSGNLVAAFQGVIQENYAMSESTWEVAQMVREGVQATDGWMTSLSNMAEEIDDAGSAADEAIGLFGGLADSVTDMGEAFAKGLPDTDDMWNLILQTGRAAGMTVDDLGNMAVELGVAEQAEIQATLAMYSAVEAWEAGESSTAKLVETTGLLTEYQEELTLAEEAAEEAAAELEKATLALAEGDEEAAKQHEAAAEAAQEMADAHKRAAEKALSLASELAGVEEAARNAVGDVNDLKDSIESLPDSHRIDIDIYYNYHGEAPPEYQHGTSFHPGGLALVGEAGPELLALPRGSRVFSAGETRQLLDQREYHYGGDTIIINDQMAAALYLEQKRRRRVEQAEARM